VGAGSETAAPNTKRGTASDASPAAMAVRRDIPVLADSLEFMRTLSFLDFVQIVLN
jgi:hypothetical protein